MYQESVGTSNENKAAMPKKGKLFFYRQRRAVAAAAALVICIGAAGIAQWRLHSEEPGPEMAAYDMAGLSAEDGIALQAEDPAAVAPDADENPAAAADRNAAQGRTVKDAEICFAEIYLEVATANSGKITWRIVNKSDTETVGWGTDYTLERFTENGWEMIEIPPQLWKHRKRRSRQKAVRQSQEKPKKERWIWLLMVSGWRQGSIV